MTGCSKRLIFFSEKHTVGWILADSQWFTIKFTGKVIHLAQLEHRDRQSVFYPEVQMRQAVADTAYRRHKAFFHAEL